MTVVSPFNPSAQWEHSILITESGHEVLTLREGEKIEWKKVAYDLLYLFMILELFS